MAMVIAVRSGRLRDSCYGEIEITKGISRVDSQHQIVVENPDWFTPLGGMAGMSRDRIHMVDPSTGRSGGFVVGEAPDRRRSSSASCPSAGRLRDPNEALLPQWRPHRAPPSPSCNAGGAEGICLDRRSRSQTSRST